MLRSFLFTPANSARKVEKALGGDADAVILDLEDAVAIEEKPVARETLLGILGRPRPKPIYVRVNAIRTAYCLQDLTVVGAAAPAGIILPKVESETDLQIADWVLSQTEAAAGLPQGAIDLMPIIETAKGVAHLHLYAGAVRRVRRLMFGAVDLGLDMEADFEAENGPMDHARFAIALASRAHGLEGPIDTAFIDIGAPDKLRRSSVGALRMGFQGKSCIHPSQVPIANEVFTPAEEEFARAERIVAAFDSAEAEGKAAIMVDRLMVDYPVADKARRLLLRRQGGAGP